MVFTLAIVMGACSDDEDAAVSSEASARRAWEGLDGFVEQGIDLGFKGMNAAKGASIPAQISPGQKGGTLTVVGKVDQGNSDNKTMDISIGMVSFSNDGKISYDTPADVAMQPKLGIKLMKIPNGDLAGTVTGVFGMTGELKGAVTLTLTIAAKLEPDPVTMLRRRTGTTVISGTAESSYGKYMVMITR